MAKLTVNGNEVEIPDGATSLSVEGGVIRVNGVASAVGYDPAEPTLIVVEGDVWSLTTRGAAEVKGNAAGVRAGTSAKVGGDCLSVEAGTGVTCHAVRGDVSAGTAVTCGPVGGNVSAGTGVTVVGDVHGSARAGTVLRCNNAR